MISIRPLVWATLILACWCPSAHAVEQKLDTITAGRTGTGAPLQTLPRWTALGRPSLALALSGGSARGIAHVGVLQALHEDGVEFDAIAGTSFGALIGAFVCAGLWPDEVEHVRGVTHVLEDEAAAGVGRGLAQAGLAHAGTREQQHGNPRGCFGACGVDDAPANGGRTRGHVGQTRGRVGQARGRVEGGLGQGGGSDQRHRQREPAGAMAHSARGAGCGHITAAVPRTKIAPPIQIQLTRGLR